MANTEECTSRDTKTEREESTQQQLTKGSPVGPGASITVSHTSTSTNTNRNPNTNKTSHATRYDSEGAIKDTSEERTLCLERPGQDADGRLSKTDKKQLAMSEIGGQTETEECRVLHQSLCVQCVVWPTRSVDCMVPRRVSRLPSCV